MFGVAKISIGAINFFNHNQLERIVTKQKNISALAKVKIKLLIIPKEIPERVYSLRCHHLNSRVTIMTTVRFSKLCKQLTSSRSQQAELGEKRRHKKCQIFVHNTSKVPNLVASFAKKQTHVTLYTA